MQRYIEETIRFSKALNLTSVKDADEFERRFIAPSVALCRWLPERGVLLDVGSGMGVPGIPILLRRRNLQGVLVERRKKRAEFLRHIVRLLSINATVYDCDICDLQDVQADVCVARAVSKPETLLPMIETHMVAHGRAVLPVPEALDANDVSGWQIEAVDDVRFGDLNQRIHCYRRLGVSRET
ncbi:MAG: class I SAM-dependent methyltransferase [Mariprofundaceae bacterium]|nr:class I SAM-dependent methyltransferase [Mariprofundaceae bacterium]